MEKKVLVFAASNSKNSINKKLVVHAAQYLNNCEHQIIDLNDYEMPLYGIDKENADGIPEKVIELNKLFDEMDGFMLALAEHNGSYTAAFKNMFDWMSRVEGDVWRNKPILLLATSPGKRGGRSVLDAAMSRFPFQGGKLTGSFSLPEFYENFSEAQGILDKKKLEELQLQVENLDRQISN